MYLRRKVFSCQPSLEEIINEVEERAFCAGYEQRLFDEEAEKEKRTKLADVEGHAGRKRSIATGILGNMATSSLGAPIGIGVGRYAGTKLAEQLDEEGADDDKILKESDKRAAIAGALSGAAGSALPASAMLGLKGGALYGLGGAALGALGGYRSSHVKTKDRLEKRQLRDLVEAEKKYSEPTATDILALKEENERRKKKRIGGHVMGALGTLGVVNHGAALAGLSGAKNFLGEGTSESFLKAAKNAKIANGIGLAAGTALTAGGLYRINKKKNRELSMDEYLAKKNKDN